MAARVLVSAGEASGDTHAAALIRAMTDLDPDLSFYGLGGQAMAQAGVELIADASAVSVTGFAEVAPKMARILGVLKKLKRALAEDRPAGFIAVDAPDLNLRLAKTARALGVPVIYYIPPQIWAWRQSRVRLLKERTDQLIVIFPFEPDFYRGHGLEAYYPGHPFADLEPIGDQKKAAFLAGLGLEADRPVVGLLPGSRPNEIARLLGPMIEAAHELSRRRPGVQFLVPIAPGLNAEEIQGRLSGLEVRVVFGQARRVLAASRAALVCSGTASLEAASCLTPLVVVYKASPFSYLIGRALIHGVRHIAMPNLIAGEKIVPELIQSRATPEAMVEAILPFLEAGRVREETIGGLAGVKDRLGPPGVVRRAALKTLEILQKG